VEYYCLAFRTSAPLLLLLFALFAISPATGDVTLSFNGEKGLLSAPLPVEYGSFNIDSSSLGHFFDFKDIRLRNLVKQISVPGAWLRIGGTASVGIAFTGANGRRNNCPGHICINTEYWDEIADFVAYTGVRLLFDFSGHWFNASNDWDPTLNVTSQLAYTQAKGYGKNWAWQMGNEGTNGHTGTQWGEYFNGLKKAIAQYPGIGQTLNGASSSVGGTSAQDFLRATKGNLDIYSFHNYGPDIKPPINMANIKNSNPCKGSRTMVDSIAPGVLVALEESACAAMGGHDGICNRFVDGYYWIHILTAAGEGGCHILHRQDVVGYSFSGLGSGYTLAGPPGWVNSTFGELNPHPDWYTMVLFKQLVGLMPLGNVSLSGDKGEIGDLDPHVWCGTKKGSVVFVYSNSGSDVHLTSVNGVMLTPRTEYILTAPSLTADEIYLNGKKMTVGEDAMLPEYPVPGSVSTTTPIVLPASSYGFVVFSGNVPGCA